MYRTSFCAREVDRSGRADRPHAGPNTPGSTARSESRAPTVHRYRFSRAELIELQGLAKLGFQDNHAGPGWERRLVPPFGTRAVCVPTAVAVFRLSWLPVIMAYAFRNTRIRTAAENYELSNARSASSAPPDLDR